MGFYRGPNIIRDGLVLHLDAANTKSALGGNLINGTGYPYLSISGWGENGWSGSIAVDFTENALKLTSTNGWHDMNYTFGVTGVTVTVSFDAKWLQKQSIGEGYVLNGTNLGSFDIYIGAISSSLSYYTFNTFTFTPTSTKICIGSRNEDSQGLTDILLIKNLKIELGSGYTNWTPSLYDNGGYINDLSEYNNNGELKETPTFDSDNMGSLSLNGSTQYISVPNSSVLGMTNAGTLSIWIYPNTLTQNSYSGLIGKDYGGGSGQQSYGIFWGGAVYSHTIRAFIESGATLDIITTPRPTEIRWYNFVFTWDGSYLNLYRDGISIATPVAQTVTAQIQETEIDIGYMFKNEEGYFNGKISDVKIYNRGLKQTEILQNFNALKRRYFKIGESPYTAAASANEIKYYNPSAADGVYWIDLPTVGPTQIYCIMDDDYDGGGWMMMMKAATGTTFNYNSNYWTTINTLNPTETNKNNGDAKFDIMNYYPSKDIMAIWPDIGTGGSITGVTNWTWLENDFNSGIQTVPIDFFENPSGMTRYYAPTYGGSGNFIKDAKTFSGWASGVFSSQVDIRFYGFNYIPNPTYSSIANVRWGFGWNENGDGLFPCVNNPAPGSNDVSGGIGMLWNSYSAGDLIACCQDSTGINRVARVELYVR